MPFPTTGILDDFNRADVDPDTGAVWGGGIETSGIGHRVVSNQAANDTGSNEGSRTANTYGPDCEVYVTIATLPSVDGDLIRLYVRLQETGGFNYDGYDCLVQYFSAGWEGVAIREILNQSATTLTNGNRPFANGDKFGLEAIGTALKFYSNEGGGGWTERLSTTDGTYTSANYLGMYLSESVSRLDDFGGGTISSGGGLVRRLVGYDANALASLVG